jgi:predicted Rossmann fold nucleotide-binding protein DprA/Smf involved in DNA uptake
MKIAVVGSRGFNDFEKLEKELNKYEIDEIISGGAKGADALAEKYAKNHNIPVKVFKPDWRKYKRGAGLIRNKQIVENADIVVAFWDGASKGTKFTIDYAKKLNKKVVIVEF